MWLLFLYTCSLCVVMMSLLDVLSVRAFTLTFGKRSTDLHTNKLQILVCVVYAHTSNHTGGDIKKTQHEWKNERANERGKKE